MSWWPHRGQTFQFFSQSDLVETSPQPSHLFQSPSPFLAAGGGASGVVAFCLSFFSFENQAIGHPLATLGRTSLHPGPGFREPSRAARR
jgi:hypothetical protein